MTKPLTPSDGLPQCPSCRRGHLHPATEIRTFYPHGQRVPVALLTSRCDACGEHTTRHAEQQENLVRLAARKLHYGGLLLGEDILALRKRYGLTQQEASKVFGKGKIAFSRYENEATYPDDSTTLLLRLAIENPAVIKSLADKAQVVLPLWQARCEDEQRVKVHPLVKIHDAAPGGVRRQALQVASVGPAPLGPVNATVWSARLVSTRRTQTLHDASNEARLSQEAIAS